MLLTAAAYVLLQALRQQAHGTDCATAQVSTLRERLLKLAVWVERSVRRIVLHLPRTAPWGATWHGWPWQSARYQANRTPGLMQDGGAERSDRSRVS